MKLREFELNQLHVLEALNIFQLFSRVKRVVHLDFKASLAFIFICRVSRSLRNNEFKVKNVQGDREQQMKGDKGVRVV